MNENDKWWSCLKVTEKERIASKIEGIPVHYPFCTGVWNKLTPKQKSWIQNHCEKRHNLMQPAWKEGQMYRE